MSYYYDPNGRRRAALMRQEALRQEAMRREQRQRMPTLDDYLALQQAHTELKTAFENQKQELARLQQELEINKDALRRQGADLKSMEAELLYTRAALQQQEGQAAPEQENTWAERYAALQTEVENLRKRWEQRFEVETTEARHRILLDMLPLADHLEMALRHAEEQKGEEGRQFVEGTEAIFRAFLETLRKYGVTPIDALGQPFDPTLHEAIGQAVVAGVPHGAVAQVVQTGYLEGEKLLRPARVLVNQGGQESGQQAEA